MTVPDWRRELPTLTSRSVTLREPLPSDRVAVASLLAGSDAARFGMEEPVDDYTVAAFLDRAAAARAAGQSFTFAIVSHASQSVVGLIQVRQLDPSFEGAEWECTLAPAVRGTGIFVEAARLAGTFAFDEIGVHRLEARVVLQHGRANGALRKLGAVQEGILRRSVRRNGQYCDQMLWSVLKEDWAPNRVAIGPRVH